MEIETINFGASLVLVQNNQKITIKPISVDDKVSIAIEVDAPNDMSLNILNSDLAS